ncbi:PREDICTED: protein GUCD1-like isoform X1 [Ipomoea nil]|uniref:protein GUCD1-like isoform X1 n=2 Tax=Ipomoea nil TaxID=35883 RepID=UPI00090164BD|nr:PREDICTED: protein GUCD1-like isoform X1 [Ipomoea nil]XP_019173467.1 PREDICTED: protein GUCD1-like isoform X1 [Ipomoea nil]XP_019173468.1 PREDICTED: protein GUCD1-like isoform X1 [Ipomoea nil]
MWPLYVLFNKFLGPQEENVHGPDVSNLSFISSFPFIQSPNGNVYNSMVVSRSFSVEVPHINQLHTWDCGLACVAMVLRTLGFSDCNIAELEELCCTRSIWTVDLAYLLQKYSVDFYYFTVTLGANPKFSVETFYKEQLPSDLVRVNTLFQKAREAGIDIECRSISKEEMSVLILSGNYIAIALVDQYKLNHSWLEDLCVLSFCSDRPGYTGHYVVICGYDADTDTFEIRDPASSRKHERVTSRCLEEARKSFGTDEDLLLVRW